MNEHQMNAFRVSSSEKINGKRLNERIGYGTENLLISRFSDEISKHRGYPAKKLISKGYQAKKPLIFFILFFFNIFIF